MFSSTRSWDLFTKNASRVSTSEWVEFNLGRTESRFGALRNGRAFNGITTDTEPRTLSGLMSNRCYGLGLGLGIGLRYSA